MAMMIKTGQEYLSLLKTGCWIQGIVILLLFSPNTLFSQFCEGSLGANIFTDGDFGSGSANIQQTDPQIAPGYTYTTVTSPVDGFYIITNNTGQWPDLFSTWLAISDNSPDPEGYMMVVNASFSPGIFYREEITNLCENTFYQFSADIINLIRPPVTGHIDPNVDFLIDGQSAFSTGNISQSGTWNTYGFFFKTDPGVTTLILELRNNAPGGLGNDLALDNITFRPCGPEALILPEGDVTVCENQMPAILEAQLIGNDFPTPVYQWQLLVNGLWQNISGATNATYEIDPFLLNAGSQQYRYLLANSPASLLNPNCRVTSDIKEVEVVPVNYIVNDTICEGSLYTLGMDILSTSGTYNTSLLSSIGCDSLIELNLVVQDAEELNATFVVFDPSCPAAADGSISIDTILGGRPPFEITIFNSAGDTVINNQLPAGTYEFELVDRFACAVSYSFDLNDPLPLVLSLGDDQNLQLGESFPLRPNLNQIVQFISWSPTDGLDCTDCLNPIARPAETTTYILTVSNGGGCEVSDSLTLFVEEVQKLFVPNIFTPNFDGINDFFTLYADAENVEEIKRFMVFDRWGNVLFSIANQPPNARTLEWDGRFKGELMGTGVYTWLAEASLHGGEVYQLSGDVLLLR